jgi:hypothetical protein
MAIKAGMTFKEAVLQLIKGFRKVTGREPSGLELIKIQQEAVQRLTDLEKVLDMQGNFIDTSKGIIGGRQIQDSPEFGKKVRETYDAAKGPGKGQEMVDALKSPGAKKSYSIMEEQLGVKLYGDESFEEILEIQRTGKHPRGEPGSVITSESLKKRLMEGKNPFSDLVEETKKGPKTMEQRRKEAEEALKNKNVIPFKDPDKKADGGRAGFIGGGIAKGLAQQIIKKYKGKIDDKLLNQMLADDNPQRLAEVMATIDEALIMQNKGMGPDEIIGTIKSSLDRKKQATGGRAGFANGGEGLMSLADKQIESLGPDAPSILLRPRASGMRREQQIAPGVNLSERDISYGISGILQGDKFYGGASLDKGKVKFDVETEDGQTLFKDTIAKDDALNFILGMGDPKGEKDKFQIKFDDDLENLSLILKKSFADGGRANFDKGGMSRRKFMKIMGGLAALPIVGKFFKGAKPAAKVADVVAKTTKAPQPPEYFFDLAAKIKILGKESSAARRERMVEVNYKNYTLEEDLVTGDMTIVKRKGDPEFGYEEEVMSLRKGQADEMTKGKTPPDEYEELTVRPDGDGKMKDVEDGIEPESVKEIMEEVGQGGGNLDQRTLEEIARGKLASGGVAMMLGE